MNTKNRFDDALSVPGSAKSFIQASEDRSKAHVKTSADVVATSIRMPKATHMRLKMAAVTEGTSLTEIIDLAVNKYLDELEKQDTDQDDGI